MQIGPGTAGLDTDARLTPAAVQAAVRGGRLVLYRYVYRSGGMDAAEAAMIRANGATPGSVYESSGSSGYDGYGMGQVEMQKAIAGHLAAGGPKGVVVYLGAFDRDGCDGGAAQPYINGAADYAHANGCGAGIYGPFGLALATSRWDGWWQTMSSGFCGNAQTSRATISQHFPYEYPGGIECDGDTIHDPAHCGAWDGAVAAPPAPPVHREDDDVYANLKPGEHCEMPLSIMEGGHVLLSSDGFMSGIGSPGVPVRAARFDKAYGWVPLLGNKPDDPGLGPDPYVTWLELPSAGHPVIITTDGAGGLLEIANLSDANKQALGMDPNRFPAGNNLGVTVLL